MTGDYGTFSIHYATPMDVAYLSTRLRKEDAQEVPTGYSTYDAIFEGYKSGQSFTIYKDRRPIGIFGATPMHDYSYIWLVGTNEMRSVRRELVKKGKYIANKLIGKYDFGANYIWIKNFASIRWLQHMGAEFGDPVILDNKKFLPFKLYKCAQS